MAKNEIFKHSDWISLPVPDDTESGQAVGVGTGLAGVAQTHEGGGGNDEGYASIALTGAFEFVKVGAGAVDVGDPVTVADVGGVGTGGTRLGHAITAVGGPDERIRVRLTGGA